MINPFRRRVFYRPSVKSEKSLLENIKAIQVQLDMVLKSDVICNLTVLKNDLSFLAYIVEREKKEISKKKNVKKKNEEVEKEKIRKRKKRKGF